jgi:hypothetical protein
VSGFLRFIGILNASIWFGAGVFFTVGILPAVFSHDMKAAFGAGSSPYFSGAVGLVLFRRFFALQYICGTIAVLHLLAEKFYTGRRLPQVGTSLVAVVFALGLIGGLWLQPKMEVLHHDIYLAPSAEQKEAAHHSFWMWHGLSQFANLLIIGGLLGHLVRMTRPPASGHGGYYQIP